MEALSNLGLVIMLAGCGLMALGIAGDRWRFLRRGHEVGCAVIGALLFVLGVALVVATWLWSLALG